MTCTQVFIYSVTNWNTPHILDMRGATSLIVQAETHFLTLDTTQGVQVSQSSRLIEREETGLRKEGSLAGLRNSEWTWREGRGEGHATGIAEGGESCLTRDQRRHGLVALYAATFAC